MSAYDPLREIRKQQEAFRKMTEPPFADVLKAQNQLMASPLIDSIRQQQEAFRKMTEPPFADALKAQRQLTESPIIDAIRKQQEAFRKMTEPPVADVLKAQNQLMASPLIDSIRQQQEAFRKMTEPPFADALKSQNQLANLIPASMLDQLDGFRQDLADRVTEQAAQDILPEEDEALSEAEVTRRLDWFQFRSLQLLIWQLEGLLKALELMTAGGFAVNQVASDPEIDPTLLTVMVMIVLTGELVLWFANRPTHDGDGPRKS